jgi:hypothetical protein
MRRRGRFNVGRVLFSMTPVEDEQEQEEEEQEEEMQRRSSA